MNVEAVRRACEVLGSQTKLAAAIGSSDLTVNRWIQGQCEVSFANAVRIDAATKGLVRTEEFFPKANLDPIRQRNAEEGNNGPIVVQKYTKAHSCHQFVSMAVKHGYIPKPSTLTCLDCGQPAQVYDHRDYNKPLDVEPVCHACNVKRGPALPFVHVNDR